MVSQLRDWLRRQPPNWRADLRVWWHIRIRRAVLSDLTCYEKRCYSQNGEDGILSAIFARIGTTNEFFVEFGVEDGRVCNTRLLRRRGWRGLQMDSRAPAGTPVRKEFVTAENLESLLDKYAVPRDFDLLSIDVDGNDYWIWRGLAACRPRVVVIEYNGAIPAWESRVIPYDSAFRFRGTDYYGASLLALTKLGKAKGYTLVACDSSGVNAFFVDDRLIRGRFLSRGVEACFRPRGAPHHPLPHEAGPWLSP